jgi:hypothetical protein
MHLGTELSQQKCPRCQSTLTAPAVYRDQRWWHVHCWQEGEHLLANAERIARSVHPALCIHRQWMPE